MLAAAMCAGRVSFSRTAIESSLPLLSPMEEPHSVGDIPPCAHFPSSVSGLRDRRKDAHDALLPPG